MRWMSLSCSILSLGWLLLCLSPCYAQNGEPEEDPYAPLFQHDEYEEHHAEHGGDHQAEGSSESTDRGDAAPTTAARPEGLGRFTLFIESYDFWKKPVLVACIAALVLGVVACV